MIDQRIALVTGGNRGIGLEVCRQLAQQDIHVILTSRNEQAGHEAADRIRDNAHTITVHRLDVSNPASVQTLQSFVADEFGRLDILVNNAGVYLDEGRGVLDIPFELLQTTMAVNTYGPFLMCQAFVPMMRKQNYGRVVNVSSGLGDINSMGGRTGAYRMSKAALNALTRIVASEVRGHNIKVNAVNPGWVRTDMGGRGAPRSVQQGADTIVWLGTLPNDGPTNGYFYDRQPVTW